MLRKTTQEKGQAMRLRKRVLGVALTAGLVLVASAFAASNGKSLRFRGVLCVRKPTPVSQRQIACYVANTAGNYTTGYAFGINQHNVIVMNLETNQIVFTRSEDTGPAKPTPPASASNMLYAGVFCQTDSAHSGVQCFLTSITGYGVEISKVGVAVDVAQTGKIVFSRLQPR